MGSITTSGSEPNRSRAHNMTRAGSASMVQGVCSAAPGGRPDGASLVSNSTVQHLARLLLVSFIDTRHLKSGSHITATSISNRRNRPSSEYPECHRRASYGQKSPPMRFTRIFLANPSRWQHAGSHPATPR
jgi:hypothetical protein